MTDKIVPRNIFNIATRIDGESDKLKACRSLMLNALQFSSRNDTEEFETAHNQLFFLVDALGDIEERLNEAGSAAYDLARAEREAEVIA